MWPRTPKTSWCRTATSVHTHTLLRIAHPVLLILCLAVTCVVVHLCRYRLGDWENADSGTEWTLWPCLSGTNESPAPRLCLGHCWPTHIKHTPDREIQEHRLSAWPAVKNQECRSPVQPVEETLLGRPGGEPCNFSNHAFSTQRPLHNNIYIYSNFVFAFLPLNKFFTTSVLWVSDIVYVHGTEQSTCKV